MCLHGALCFIPFTILCKMTMFSKSWIFTFWPLNICHQVAAFMIPLIWYGTWPCSDKVVFWLLTPTSGSTFGGVCRQNICYHVDPIPRVGRGICGLKSCYHAAAFMIPFDLICNMTMFWFCWSLTFWPNPNVRGWGLQAKYLLPYCYIRDFL